MDSTTSTITEAYSMDSAANTSIESYTMDSAASTITETYSIDSIADTLAKAYSIIEEGGQPLASETTCIQYIFLSPSHCRWKNHSQPDGKRQAFSHRPANSFPTASQF